LHEWLGLLRLMQYRPVALFGINNSRARVVS